MPETSKRTFQKKNTVRVSLDLPRALRDQIQEAATREGRSFASAARDALREWAERAT